MTHLKLLFTLALAVGLLWIVGCSRPQVAPQPRELPYDLPAEVHTALGPIKVEVRSDIRGVQNQPIMAGYDPALRIVYVNRDVRDRAAMWQAFYHEICHVTLFDSGVAQLIPDRLQDAICDATATARVAEMQRGAP